MSTMPQHVRYASIIGRKKSKPCLNSAEITVQAPNAWSRYIGQFEFPINFKSYANNVGLSVIHQIEGFSLWIDFRIKQEEPVHSFPENMSGSISAFAGNGDSELSCWTKQNIIYCFRKLLQTKKVKVHSMFFQPALFLFGVTWWVLTDTMSVKNHCFWWTVHMIFGNISSWKQNPRKKLAQVKTSSYILVPGWLLRNILQMKAVTFVFR